MGTLNDYANKVLVEKQHESFIPDNELYQVLYLSIGLQGEFGEFCEKVKKIIRDKNGVISDKDKTLLKKELGDVMWYWVALCEKLQINPEDVLETNIEKLSKRCVENKIHGDGDER